MPPQGNDVEWVKGCIKDNLGVPYSQQRPTLAGKQLEDDQTLTQLAAELPYDQVLALDLSLASGMQIIVKTLSNKRIVLDDVGPRHLVQSVKFKIADKEGIPPDHQRLCFAGKQLKDARTLQEYSIQNNDVLILLVSSGSSGSGSSGGSSAGAAGVA